MVLIKLRRRTLRLFLLLVVLAGGCLAIYRSIPVQKLLYPIPHQTYVFGYAASYQLDPYLVASVIRAESRFFHNAESGSGARGLMQVMPDTAKWAAEKLNIKFRPEMLFDPKYNIRIGCWYLQELFDVFGGNLIVVLAAYNAGQGNVAKWLDEGIWDGTMVHLQQIPFPETRIYVKKVLDNYKRYKKLYAEREVP